MTTNNHAELMAAAQQMVSLELELFKFCNSESDKPPENYRERCREASKAFYGELQPEAIIALCNRIDRLERELQEILDMHVFPATVERIAKEALRKDGE